MDRTEHLLTILSEECAEVSQRVTKSLRFGINETQEGQELNNADRLTYELSDLFAVYEMLVSEGVIPKVEDNHDLNIKKKRVEKYLLISKGLGRLN